MNTNLPFGFPKALKGVPAMVSLVPTGWPLALVICPV